MIPVANSSVLISLGAIGQLSLLLQRFPQGLRVPEAVWREVVLTGKGRPGAEAVAQTNWIMVQAVQNRALVSLLRTDLDEGEAEALVLAQEQHCSLLLLDEKHARRAALRLGMTPLGTVGILLWAKQAGFILICEKNWTLYKRTAIFGYTKTFIGQRCVQPMNSLESGNHGFTANWCGQKSLSLSGEIHGRGKFGNGHAGLARR